MDRVKTFWLEPTKLTRRSLRRYRTTEGKDCEKGGYCNASVVLDTVEDTGQSSGDHHPHDDPRWPKVCEACGLPFTEADNWQLFSASLWKDTRNGNLTTLDEADPGAVWNAHWITSADWTGPDGKCIVVKLPDRVDWMVDSRASNCTKPDDKVHRCWCRHGDPVAGTLHVDKVGNTCAAGAGSIMSHRGWHGFLRHGWLEQC